MKEKKKKNLNNKFRNFFTKKESLIKLKSYIIVRESILKGDIN